MNKILRKGCTTLEVVSGNVHSSINSVETNLELDSLGILVLSTKLNPIDDNQKMDVEYSFRECNQIIQIILKDKYIKDRFSSFTKPKLEKIKGFKIKIFYEKEEYLYKAILSERDKDDNSLIYTIKE